DPLPPGRDAHRLRVRRRRHGRHDLHAILRRLRLREPRADPAVPVLGHVLPALPIPDWPAVADPGHAPVPGRRPRPLARVRRPELDPPPPRRVPRGDGPGRRTRRRPPSGPPASALTRSSNYPPTT